MEFSAGGRAVSPAVQWEVELAGGTHYADLVYYPFWDYTHPRFQVYEVKLRTNSDFDRTPAQVDGYVALFNSDKVGKMGGDAVRGTELVRGVVAGH